MKIVVERKKCIGCGSCVALCPVFWEMGEDGKSNLKDSATNQNTGNQELEIEAIQCAQEAADACPVQIIHIEQ
ncbi:MAG: ferredoxin [Candidatus Nealsonbacteria bacterium CG_4_10_14_0_2_um_filter_38_17]|uniref:Ferredoxin n=2 Tax=Candidatus Nealsoniibacteriota TaxID=1817911 RepID=A0A2M7UYH8_9BACT|nr:MAG: ferredoxin [Candidatus Nealsonbacteria bacterium CG23_combo_of_CG06-09_8_20_14_all_38_19]PIZ89036.1 MAG: ferredoxin [Candidatus Nealsonbacteria bacterium CG_4_10_14_0_2_um_filter_38_17]